MSAKKESLNERIRNKIEQVGIVSKPEQFNIAFDTIQEYIEEKQQETINKLIKALKK